MADDTTGEQNAVVRSVSRLLRAFGIVHPIEVSNTSAPEIVKKHLGTYTQLELSNMAGFEQNVRNLQVRQRESFDGVNQQLNSVARSTKMITDKLKNLSSIAPEIPLARLILVSSIMSPNDMQTDLVSVCTTDETIDDNTRQAASKLLDDYFNEQLHYGEKLERWIGTALVDKGAIGIVILPQSNIRQLNSITEMWKLGSVNGKFGSSIESLEGYLPSDPEIKELSHDSSVITDTLVDACRELEAFPDMQGLSDDDLKTISKGLVQSSFKILKQNKDFFVISTDIRSLNTGKSSLKSKIDDLTRQADKVLSSVNPEDDHGDTSVKPRDPILSIVDIDQMLEYDVPVLLELPTECIVPVCVPGSIHEKIGYFVLFGEDGMPLQVPTENAFMSELSVEKMSSSASSAMYGNSTGITQTYSKLSADTRFSTSSAVFRVAIKHLLENKLDKMGLSGLEVGLHSAVGKSIFYNLLQKNHIRVVFVPAPLMQYFAFDFRDDGTGKSILEDIEFILSMRTTLLVAELMAAIENSTRYHIVEVNVDEQNTNVLQTLEAVRRAYLLKHAPKFTTDPTMAASENQSHHLVVKPKSIAGTTQDLEISTDTRAGNSPTPDSNLLDKLNNWVGLGLFIPPTALNQLSETEYSRSIASANLFFANRCRSWQNKLHPINKQFAQNYVRNHSGLMKQLRELFGTQEDEEEAIKSHVGGDIDRTKDTINDKLIRLVAGIEINLPKPNVSTSKAHYEELRNYMEAVDSIVQKRYPDELAGDDSTLVSEVRSIRAVVSQRLIADYAEQLGLHDLCDIPSMDDAALNEGIATSVFLKNRLRGKQNLNKLVDPAGAENSSGSGY